MLKGCSSGGGGGGSGTISTGTAGQLAIYAANGTTLSGTTNISNFPTNRPPLATDDSTKGYAIGNLWNYNGKIWICQNAATGVAVWQSQVVSPDLMLDLVPSALVACAVFKLRTAYAGNCFTITRSSDSTTLAIGFDAFGIADWKAVDAFISGTFGWITTWNDQSGNGNDLTQPTTSAPIISVTNPGGGFNGIRSVCFNSIGASIYMENTSVAITNVNNATVCLLTRIANSHFNGVVYQLGDATDRMNLITLTGTGITSTQSNISSAEQLLYNPQFLVDVSASTGRTLYQNNRVSTSFGTPSNAATGVVLSNGIGNVFATPQDALAFIVYNSALSTANVQTLQKTAFTVSKIQPQACDNFAYIGDSLMAGKLQAGSTQLQTLFPIALQTDIQHPFNYYQYGISGALASAITTYAATLAPLTFRSGVFNVVCVEGGTNDIAASTVVTPATVYTYLKSICTSFKSAGFQKVCLSTLLPRNGLFSGGQTQGGFETTRLALNVLIRAGQGIDYDVLVDMGGDAVIGVEATFCTATYSIDNVHPNVLGHAFEGAVYEKALVPIL